jgi:hypothetical protein
VRRTPAAVLSAVTLVAAFGLVGCADTPAPAPGGQGSMRNATVPPAPAVAPLPPPDQLTAVLYRLADTSVPGEQKVGLIQYATPDDAAALANFAEALKDSGFAPLTVDAANLAWGGEPGDVVATVTLGSADPQVRPFTFAMEFVGVHDAWQLSKRTADQLLPLVGAPTPAPTG